ncbi:GDSL-type esterase/lipase family protein, partial [Salmonella enterica subsp. enterica serovar Typhimurium]|nr:GDSL-type esterase/lipase family protein [Salmonella enterica subsp. enterica serovar Typhimurium]
MGDSLSAAYGLPARQGWVALTAERIARQHPGWKVVNASVSGETTAGGRSRIARDLQRHRPALVVIALGANDGLRGLPLAQMKANLEAMVLAAKGSGARVLLLGMRLPPN